jgi:hypothetical protein
MGDLSPQHSEDTRSLNNRAQGVGFRAQWDPTLPPPPPPPPPCTGYQGRPREEPRQAGRPRSDQTWPRAPEHLDQDHDDRLADIESRLRSAVVEVLLRKPAGLSVQLLLSPTVQDHTDVRLCFAELDNFIGRKVSRPQTLRRIGMSVVSKPVVGGHGEHHLVFLPELPGEDRNPWIEATLQGEQRWSRARHFANRVN